jgi:hypothetical protein
MVLSETRAYSFVGYPGGIECLWRLGASGTQSLAAPWILSLEPERLQNLTDHRPE